VETWEAIRSRRNVRSYSERAIAPEDLDQILEAGRRTPSAGNQQAWDFVVCTDPEQLGQLASVWRSAGHVARSAATIALIAPNPGDARSRDLIQYDLGQATMSIMLAAADLGIGSAHSAVSDQELARRLLGFPEDRFSSTDRSAQPAPVRGGCAPRPLVAALRSDRSRGLDPLDGRQPGRCAVVVVSRVNPVRFDGGDLPSRPGVERRAQLFLPDGVRARIGTIVTEAQHIQGSVVLGHRRQARHISWSLVAVEGVEQSAVQHRREPAPQTLQLERVRHSERNLDPTVVGLRSGDGQCRLRHVNAQNRQSQRGDVQRVLAGPAARIEHRSGEAAFGRQPRDGRLRPADVPRRRAVVVRRIPGQSRQPLVTGWAPTTERIVSDGP
jgi:hypothetical protein